MLNFQVIEIHIATICPRAVTGVIVALCLKDIFAPLPLLPNFIKSQMTHKKLHEMPCMNSLAWHDQ
jgi:hypothetical protein